jgi:hypothetical protein
MFDSILQDLLEGFTCDANGIVLAFKTMFEQLTNNDNLGIRAMPNCIVGQTLKQGAIHCLNYGDHQDLPKTTVNVRSSTRRARTCMKQRVLKPKNPSYIDRSRSRSPSPDSDIGKDSHRKSNKNPREEYANILIHMCAFPRDYNLKSEKYGRYFEPHIPDGVIYHISQHKREESLILVIEVSSYKSLSSTGNMNTHLSEVVDQNVRQCVAALTEGQEWIFGLVFVPDGLKLVKIEKSVDQVEGPLYTVYETKLVLWQDRHNILRILQQIRQSFP